MYNTNPLNWYGGGPSGLGISGLVEGIQNGGGGHVNGNSNGIINGNNTINHIANNYRQRSVSNSNPSLERQSDVHVEYEVAVPIVPSFRHTPYHSLWDLHQW